MSQTTPPNGPAQSVIVDVVHAVAEDTGRNVAELPPLHDSINGDALNLVFSLTPSTQRSGEVSFLYAGCHVTVEMTAGAEPHITIESSAVEQLGSSQRGTESAD